MGTPRPIYAALVLLAVVSINCGLAETATERLQSSDLVARITGQTPTATRERPTPRPTFTPTPNYTATPTTTATPTITPIPTDTPTPVPTNTSAPTDTPVPTDTAVPTKPPPPPPTAPPADTATPAPPPTPSFPFKLREQGDRSLQKTNNSILSNIIAVTDGSNTPAGGYFLVGVHSTGIDYKSLASSWQFDAMNGLSGYIKQGNLKFEPPGGFQDGTWTVWLVDSGGAQVSEKVSLSYSSDPTTWAWDFLWFAQG